MKHKSRLERWIVFNDVLVGYLFDSKEHPPGTRVMTEAIRYIDPLNSVAESRSEVYKLGEPGTVEEHNQPLLGQ
jgi:hypothetical protein